MKPSDYEIVLLRPCEVLVDRDHDVQRDFKVYHAKAIAKDYEPALFGVGYVSLRADGKYYLLDGQHRSAAAIIAGRGADPVPYYVLRGLTIAREAELFDELNRHKLKPDAVSSFKIGVEAKNPVNLEIAKVLESFGLKVNSQRSEGTITAVASLISVYNGRLGIKPAHKEKSSKLDLPKTHLLSRTLQVLTKAWGRDRTAYDGILIRGIAAFIYKHDTKVEGSQLAGVLAKNSTPTRVIGQIKALKEISKITPAAAAVQFLEGIYNRNLALGKKLK